MHADVLAWMDAGMHMHADVLARMDAGMRMHADMLARMDAGVKGSGGLHAAEPWSWREQRNGGV